MKPLGMDMGMGMDKGMGMNKGRVRYSGSASV